MSLDSLTPIQAVSLADALLIPGIIIAAAAAVIYQQNRKLLGKAGLLVNLRSAMVIGLVLMIFGAHFGVGVIQTMDEAYAHGLPADTDYTLGQIKERTKLSPASSELPEDIRGSILIYYKFGCPDCEDVYHEMIAAAKQSNACYFVATGSEDGQRLLENYPVEEAPSGVYVMKDGTVPYVTYKLFTKDESDVDARASFNYETWERLLELQRQGR